MAIPKKRLATSEDLEKVLRRYESAVNETEVAGDDSDDAVKELKDARDGLMAVLRQAKIYFEEHA